MTVNIHAAKTKLSQLVARAEKGERITIAPAGKPVAQLGPVRKARASSGLMDDPLLRVEEYAVDGPGGTLSAREIDRIVYGG